MTPSNDFLTLISCIHPVYYSLFLISRMKSKRCNFLRIVQSSLEFSLRKMAFFLMKTSRNKLKHVYSLRQKPCGFCFILVETGKFKEKFWFELTKRINGDKNTYAVLYRKRKSGVARISNNKKWLEIMSAGHGSLNKPYFFYLKVAVGHKTKCNEDFLSSNIINVLVSFFMWGGRGLKFLTE